MNYVTGFECTICGQIYPHDMSELTCPKCGESGILEVLYDYDSMKKHVDRHYFNNTTENNILRYQPLMSIQPTDLDILQVGLTPLYKSHNLAKRYGLSNLLIKDDTVNPTASLKDRASVVACLKAIEQGYDTVCCSSTGNAASSLAGNAAKLGLQSVIFVPKRVPQGKLAQLIMYGANVIAVDGDYKQTFDVSKKVIETFKLYNRNAAINPHLVEGKKTVAFEIAEQYDFKAIDYVFVSVGDGCTIAGVYKGFYDLYQLGLVPRIPKIIGVQSDGCSPFVDAFIKGSDIEESEENTIADSIAVGIPRNPVKGMKAVVKSNGLYVKVSDTDILDAMSILGSEEGIFAEPAGATGLAGLLKLLHDKTIDPSSTIAIIITGNGLKDTTSISDKLNDQLVIDPMTFINNIQNTTNKSLKELHTILQLSEVEGHE